MSLDVNELMQRGPREVIDGALTAVREHLGMDIAYLSEFIGDRSVFRAVSAPGLEHLAKVDDAHDIKDVYCQHILDGRLPELIPDTSAEPIAVALPITATAPIGSHVSVPIHRPDGSVYGMFCCLAATPRPDLNPRDLAVMRMFADLAADQVNNALSRQSRIAEVTRRMNDAIKKNGIDIVYQPIFDLGQSLPGRIRGAQPFPRRTASRARSLVQRGGRCGHAGAAGGTGDRAGAHRARGAAAARLSVGERVSRNDRGWQLAQGVRRVRSRTDRAGGDGARGRAGPRGAARGPSTASRGRRETGGRRCRRGTFGAAADPSTAPRHHKARRSRSPATSTRIRPGGR